MIVHHVLIWSPNVLQRFICDCVGSSGPVLMVDQILGAPPRYPLKWLRLGVPTGNSDVPKDHDLDPEKRTEII